MTMPTTTIAMKTYFQRNRNFFFLAGEVSKYQYLMAKHAFHQSNGVRLNISHQILWHPILM